MSTWIRLGCLVWMLGLVGCSLGRVLFTPVADGPVDASPLPDSGSDDACTSAACVKYGAGTDGDVSLSSERNINTDNLGASSDANGEFADGVAFRVAVEPTGRSIIVAGTVTGAIVAGDELLLINMQGTPGDTSSVGKYEVLEVTAASGNEITVAQPIANGYGGQSFRNQMVVVQRVPAYNSVIETTGGLITTSPWDGLAGATTGGPVATGIVAMFVRGTLSVDGSGIDVSTKGFRGGVAGSVGPEDASNPTITTSGESGGSGAAASPGGRGGGAGGGGAGGGSYFSGGAAGRGGGGGGSSIDDNNCGLEGSGGGGAAPYASGANQATLLAATLTLGGGAAAGGGGGAGGIVANLSPRFESSGGNMNGMGGTTGQPFSAGGNGSAGDAGGGIIFIIAGTFAGPGKLSANGGNGGSGGGGGGGVGYDGSAGGGGGAGASGAAGGSIFVRHGVSTWSGSTSASGGDGGGGGGGGAGDGGGSGGGGGGGIGGGGGGGGTRTACSQPLANASNGGGGGFAGSCGAVAQISDSSVGGGGAANGGGGTTLSYDCTNAGANTGGGGNGNSGSNGSPDVNGGIGGAGGDAREPIWGSGGGGGQAGSVGAPGFTRLESA